MDEAFYLFVIKEYEKKLKSLMDKNDFQKFVKSVSKAGFEEEIKGMKDSEFKNFCLDNIEKITE